MGITAVIVGIIGGLCAVMGIITAAQVIPALSSSMPQFTWNFWLALSAILLLAAIAFTLGRGYES
ncbi:hypothetical protein ACFLW4_00990 [Chloroflexota bacterium]